MNIISFIYPVTVATFTSKINKKIFVKEFFGKKYIEVDGLTQSGKLLEKLFFQGFRRFKLINPQNQINQILLLGIGGGTLVSQLNSYFPQAKIVAIDIDQQMVEIGKIFFDLQKVKDTQIIIGDIFDTRVIPKQKFDLIIVDVFVGYDIPENLGNDEFLNLLRNCLTKNGVVIFNRLYFQRYKIEADKFLDKVKKIFHDVNVFKYYFNILIQAY